MRETLSAWMDRMDEMCEVAPFPRSRSDERADGINASVRTSDRKHRPKRSLMAQQTGRVIELDDSFFLVPHLSCRIQVDVYVCVSICNSISGMQKTRVLSFCVPISLALLQVAAAARMGAHSPEAMKLRASGMPVMSRQSVSLLSLVMELWMIRGVFALS